MLSGVWEVRKSLTLKKFESMKVRALQSGCDYLINIITLEYHSLESSCVFIISNRILRGETNKKNDIGRIRTCANKDQSLNLAP